MDKVDMSLDDIIKMQRKQKQKKLPNKGPLNKNKNTKQPYITKQTMQKKLANTRVPKRNQQGKLNLKPKPMPNRPNQNQNQRKQNQNQRKQNQVRPGKSLPLQQQKAQKLQQRIDQRRRLQQNRMKVSRPGSVKSNTSNISDAKLLKIAKALLLKKTGANLLTTPPAVTNVAYSARRLTAPQRSAQTSPKRKRNWNRLANANPNQPDALLTVSVKNEFANSSKRNDPTARRPLKRPQSDADTGANFLVQTINTPAPSARTGPAISDIVKSMKPKVAVSYEFSKDVFSTGKTQVGLSQRFSSSAQSSHQQPAPGSRQVFI